MLLPAFELFSPVQSGVSQNSACLSLCNLNLCISQSVKVSSRICQQQPHSPTPTSSSSSSSLLLTSPLALSCSSHMSHHIPQAAPGKGQRPYKLMWVAYRPMAGTRTGKNKCTHTHIHTHIAIYRHLQVP